MNIILLRIPNMARRDELTDYFAQPQSTQHRRYEVCRAYFLERDTDRQIAERLRQEGRPLSQAHVGRQLAADGFPRLRSRGRPTPPGEQAWDGSEVPQVADVNALDLTPDRIVPTQAAGLFLFVPDLLALQIDRASKRSWSSTGCRCATRPRRA